MSGNSSDPSGQEAWVQGLLKGWKKRFPKELRAVRLRGKVVPVRVVLARLRHCVEAFEEVHLARVVLSQAVADRDREFKQFEPTLEAIEAVVRSMHGHSTQELADYDLAPPKRTKPTAEKLAIGTQLRLESRQVHHVMGKKQRAQITLTPKPTLEVRDGKGRRVGPKQLPEGDAKPTLRLTAGTPDDTSTEE